MSINWTNYLPEVLPEVEGCPKIQAINAIRNAAIEFCEKSRVWEYNFTSKVALVAAQASYVLVPPTGSEIVAVTYLGFLPVGATKSRRVDGPIGEPEMDEKRPAWREENSTGTTNTVDLFTQLKNTIRLVPIPVVNQSDALVVSAALKPTRASTYGDDRLYDEWLEFIAHGAKQRLMMVPKKPWSNPELAEWHRTMFRRGINRALARRQKGGGDRSLTANPRSFTEL